MRDYDIRQHLRSNILLNYINDSNSKVVEELDITSAGARIDIAIINGSLHGFEIKSDKDNLNRLPSQIEAYSKIFDYISVVAGPKHIDGIIDILPEWVGIYICQEKSNGVKLRKQRAAKKNISQDGFYLAKLLWRDELISIFEEYGIEYNKKDRNWTLCEILASEVPIKKLSAIVRVKLKQRPDWKLL